MRGLTVWKPALENLTGVVSSKTYPNFPFRKNLSMTLYFMSSIYGSGQPGFHLGTSTGGSGSKEVFLFLSGDLGWSKGSSDKWRNVFSPFRQRWSLEIVISRSEKGWSGIIYLLLAHLSPSGTTRLALQTILLRLYSSPSFVRRVNPGAHWIWIGVGWSCWPTFLWSCLQL